MWRYPVCCSQTTAWLQRTWVYCLHILSPSQPSDLIRSCLHNFWKAAWICSTLSLCLSLAFIVYLLAGADLGISASSPHFQVAGNSSCTNYHLYVYNACFFPDCHSFFVSKSHAWFSYSFLSSTSLSIIVSESYPLLHWILCHCLFFSLFWLQQHAAFLISCHCPSLYCLVL